ncbi:S26 family signal peptidase [Candidatus Manganitrophus noduliformans]|uniref:Peptidase n=1 Tax=Candidatus Manganitrophus noduliformans TaxID=2606439 RepID=A0A7X6DN31_9BACT|nr:S26 family signal peptidase [Candidatus Manganitrophus noduliformans]NKE70170.1 peptidase [Candidatus Manganitrophus noduliformans]
MRKSSPLRLIIFMTALLLAGSWIPQRFTVTITPSLWHRIYLLDRAPSKEQMVRNAYVLFELNSRYLKGAKTQKTLKQVACAAGDMLTVKERSYYCNDTYLGQAKDYSLKGERLPHLEFEGVIPKGSLFVFGTHVDSLDSRYFGFVRKEDVIAIAYPVF